MASKKVNVRESLRKDIWNLKEESTQLKHDIKQQSLKFEHERQHLLTLVGDLKGDILVYSKHVNNQSETIKGMVSVIERMIINGKG